jgi:hypothetical protein
MSYDVYLRDSNGVPVQVPAFSEGGILMCNRDLIAIGMSEAWINITWNYSKYFRDALDATQGIRWLYGKTGAETVEQLEKAVQILGTERCTDYWRATPGNSGYILYILLGWAKLHPEAVWEGD